MQGEITMSNYNVGAVIRLTRQAMNISQEKLCENICSVQTLSRIENGRTSVKKSIYEQLMQRMGRNGRKNFSVLSVDDYDMLEIMDKADVALAKHDYQKTEEYLIILKNNLNEKTDDNLLTKQYIGRKELNIAYHLKKISKNDYLQGLKELIRLTIKEYEVLLDREFPFFKEEIHLLMNIANGYAYMSKHEQSIKINKMLLRSLDRNYMCLEDTIKLKTALMFNAAKSYGEIENHKEAIKIYEKAIKLAKKYKITLSTPNLYLELSWNMIQQIEKGERERKDLYECEKFMRQGYALASLTKKNSIKMTAEQYFKEYFKRNIYDSNSCSYGDP